MSQKLFVGGLSYNTTEDILKAEFAKAGTVESAVIIMDKMTGRSRGFGFVEMSNEAEGENAIKMFDGKDLDGRNIKVNVARPMTERKPRQFGGGGFNRGGYGDRE